MTLAPAEVRSGTPGPTPAPGSPNLNLLWTTTLFGALRRGGVRHVSLAPGSRSAPLAIAAARMPGLDLTVHVDERSAAFFALGAAKATGTPAVVVCTSGSAAGHFLPALIEAAEGRIPLIALTADRPPEVRGFSAPQAIDQVKLFGDVVRAARDLPLPDLALLERLELLAADACAVAQGAPRGPVHLNVPLRDPLAPMQVDAEAIAALEVRHVVQAAAARRTGGNLAWLPPRDVWPGQIYADEVGVEAAARWLAQGRRPLIVAGPDAAALADRWAILDLARAWGAPILADAASGLRFGPDRGAVVCAHAAAFLRAPAALADVAPDRVVSIGMSPTSGTVVRYLARHRPPTLRLQADLLRRDPEGLAVRLLQGDVAEACRRLTERSSFAQADPAWKGAFGRSDRLACAAKDAGDAKPPEVAALLAAFDAVPPEGVVFLSSSMTIRYADSCLGRKARAVRVLANRGANGIDGLVSTALGVAAGAASPLLLVIGDVAFLHDLGGLYAARHMTGPVVLLVLNDDGGGIFSYLPIGGFPEVAEPLCSVPHGMSFEAAARLFHIGYAACASPEAVATATLRAFDQGGVHLLEVRTDRRESEPRYRNLLAAMAAACEDVGV